MKRATASAVHLNDHSPNTANMVAFHAKRVRLNHNMDQFPLAAHIVKQFMASVNVFDIKISWPRDMGKCILNDVDWIGAMIAKTLHLGIAGYRVKYLPFYRAELVCSSSEFGGFVYKDNLFSWRSTALQMKEVMLPTYISASRRPFTYERENSEQGWLFNGVINHHDFDYNTHNELTDDTLRASSRSSEGNFTRTVKFSPDLPLETVKRSIEQARINPVYMVTEPNDGYKEDAKAIVQFTHTMVNASADQPSDWKASMIPSGVEQQRIPPAKSFIGGLIAVEEQILHRMSLLVFKCTPECQRCIEECTQGIYDAFLKPEIFYMQYILMYQDLRNQLVSAVTGTPIGDGKEAANRLPAEQAARAFIIFRNQIAKFAQMYEESSAHMVAFMANLDVQQFVQLVQDVQERYTGTAASNMSRNGAVRLLLQWLRHEVQFCTDRINEVQEERHPPAKKKKTALPPPENEEREERLKREAEERKAKRAEVEEWEREEQDVVSYTWKIATPDIANQDYGQPSLTREKRDQ